MFFLLQHASLYFLQMDLILAYCTQQASSEDFVKEKVDNDEKSSSDSFNDDIVGLHLTIHIFED